MSHPRRFAQLFPLRFAQVVEGCHDDVKGISWLHSVETNWVKSGNFLSVKTQYGG